MPRIPRARWRPSRWALSGTLGAIQASQGSDLRTTWPTPTTTAGTDMPLLTDANGTAILLGLKRPGPAIVAAHGGRDRQTAMSGGSGDVDDGQGPRSYRGPPPWGHRRGHQGFMARVRRRSA